MLNFRINKHSSVENPCNISEESENNPNLHTVYLNTSVGEFLEEIHRRHQTDFADNILFMMEIHL